MKNLESPAKAERKQAAMRSYLPPIWPLLLAAVVIAAIVIAIRH